MTNRSAGRKDARRAFILSLLPRGRYVARGTRAWGNSLIGKGGTTNYAWTVAAGE